VPEPRTFPTHTRALLLSCCRCELTSPQAALCTGASAALDRRWRPFLPPGTIMTSSTSSNPNIRVYDTQHAFELPHHRAVPMAINPRAREQIPPPLPPPRHIHDLRSGQDPGWQWGNTNSPRDTGFGGNRLASVRPGSSLYGSNASTQQVPREPSTDYIFHNNGRDSSLSTSMDDMSSEHSDEDRHSQSRPSLGSHR
jgi:hypothetical protein